MSPAVPLIVLLSLLAFPAPSSAAASPSLLSRAPAGPAPAPDPFGWPLVSARVVRWFDPPPRPWLAGHRGADLAGRPAETVRAAGAGTVVYAGVIAGRGVVSVAHAGGLRTTYEPVTPSVAVGTAVGPGAGLGTLDAGHPGCAEPACLHWGLRRGDVYLDPLILLGMGRVRLLPLGARP